MNNKENLEELAQKANSLYNSGAYQEAREPLLKILNLQPDNDSVMHMLAFAEHQKGANKEAISLLNKALKVNPNNINCYNLKGYLSAITNDFESAEDCYVNALKINPNLANVQKNLGMIYINKQKYASAIDCFSKAVLIDPDNLTYKQLFSSISADYNFSEFDENTKKVIELCLSEENITHKFLETNWINLLHNHPDFSILREIDIHKPFADFAKNSDTSILISILNNSYFLRGLGRFYLTSLHYEKILTKIREYLLLSIEDNKKDCFSLDSCTKLLPFIQSLAIQCWSNEYVYSVSDDEENIADELKKELETKDNLTAEDILKISILGCYEPLYKLKNVDTIIQCLKEDKTEVTKNLIRDQIENPLKEIKIKSKIPVHGKIENNISQNVKEQYEENPYPRWKSINTNGLADQIDKERKEILIAGCGTGQEPAAMKQLYPNANFTCVDLSRSSLAYAIRQCSDLNILENLDFIQADILQLDSLDKKFDLVISSGVLHHMEDPEAGLKVLQSLLKQKGIMHISLYSETARPHVVAARKYIKKESIGDSPKDIRNMREIIMNHPDEMIQKCMSAGDFFTMSQCRDLIFHVQEHRFTIPKIKKMLERHSLSFLGFFSLTQHEIQQFYERFSSIDAHQNLDNWEQLEREKPEMFMNKMYKFKIGHSK